MAKAKYIVTKAHTFVPANEVYFFYSLDDATEFQFQKFWDEPNTEWLVAMVLGPHTDGLFFRFARWVKEKLER